VSPSSSRREGSSLSPTWDQFKAAVRRQDRDSLLLLAARLSAAAARDEMPEEATRYGLNPWNLASVARTALAWSRFHRPLPTAEDVLRLCTMDANLSDGELPSSAEEDQSERLSKILTRIFFEQFPGQRSALAEVARTVLLFGSASEQPTDFAPEAMAPGWFEAITGGLPLDEYVAAIFLIFVGAQTNNGVFDLRWLDGPRFAELSEVIELDAVRRTFVDFLRTTPDAFKEENRRWQDPLPPSQKKYAFNPLQDKPFIEIAPSVTVAPWVQAILMKALPPSIYFMGLRAYGEAFTRDLGHVFQHYVGRQLRLIEGPSVVISEVAYGPRTARRDSCDWFLDLPGLLVLIECKARQPIESLRTGGDEWLRSVEGSIHKGIAQLGRSNQDIAAIAAENTDIDANKPRVGLVVTLEPFYINNNPMLQKQLPAADIPVGVISIGELEALVRADAEAIAAALLEAPRESENQIIRLAPALEAPSVTDNELLVATWDSLPFFRRLATYSDEAQPVEGPEE